ncbi:MAG: NCS2 family permease [Bacilli bacterium]
MFKLQQHGTTVQREMLAGLTTFLTMAYIIVVNPMILQDAGIPFQTGFTATVIAAVVGCLLMGLWGNFPIAIAPGMGLNAYFAYSVVQTNGGLDPKAAFAAVFVAGLVFLLLAFTKFRNRLIESIPDTLKHAIAAGIGLFVAFIGLRLSGLIAAHPSNLVAIGDLHSTTSLLTLFGLAVTLILFVRKVPGALFIGMFFTAIAAYFTGVLKFDNGFVQMPALPETMYVTNPISAIQTVFELGLFGVVFSFLLVTIFDTTGTFIGVAQQAGLAKEDGSIPRAERSMISDAIATLVGAMFGTSPTTSYIESMSGVAAGGRTGLVAVTVAGLFALSTFFAPLFGAISGVSAITAPALIIVGSLMITNVRHIDWTDFEETFPAFLVILTMPLTSSIATGIALGFISYTILKVVMGKGREVKPLIYVFAVLFAIQLMFFPH